MSEFSTESTVEILVEERSLRQARQEVEAAFEDVPVTVSSGGGSRPPEMRSDGGNGASGGRRSARLAEAQTENLEDAVYYLESIDDALSEGGLLGGGGGLAAEVLGIGGDFAAEGAGAAAETATGLATDVAGTALGQAAGSVIADQVSGSTVGVEPNPLPVEDSGGGKSGGDTLSPTISTNTELSPEFSPTFEPTFTPELSPDFSTELSPEFDLPELEFGGGGPGSVRVDESQLPLSVEETTLAVEETTLPVEETTVELSLVSGDTRQAGFFERAGNDLDNITGGGDGPFGPIGRTIDTVNPTTSGGYGSGGSSTAVTNDIDADVSPQFTINVETDRLINDVEKMVERAQEEVRRELLDKIESVEGDIDDLESEITGRR